MAMHKVRTTRRRVAAIALSVGLLAAACGGGDDSGDASGGSSTTKAPSGTPVKGGSLTFATESNVATLEPGAAAQPADKVITLGIYDPLTTYEDGKLVPFLAQSLEASDDLLTYQMELRSGVTFQDGTPLDADAVVKHFKRLQDPAIGCPCQTLVSIIKSMDTPDGATGLKVTFHLATASVGLPDLLAGSSGYIESPAAVAKYGADFKNHPVGTGPFSLTEFTPGERVVLTANPTYWGKDANGIQLPYLDKLTVVPIADSGQRVAALEAGDIDIFQTADSGTIAQAEKAGFTAEKISGSSSTIVLFNNAKPPFDDVRARQAVAYSINKDVLNERLYSGVRTPSYSAFATTSPYYNPDAGTPKYDLDKAKALVKDLGGLKFTIACIPTPEADGILQLVKQMGEAAGMQITLETQEQGAYVNRIFAKGGDYEAACFRSAHFLEPDAWRPTVTTGDTNNLIFYSNPEVDKLLDEARSTADVAKRKELYAEAQAITGKEVPSLTTLYDLFGNVYNAKKVGPPPPGEANSLGAIKPALLYAVK
jgi:4-phytase/acid phosphatase/peptide/nickel transport system substrate-binding protein